MDMTSWLEYFVNGLSIQLAEVRAHGEQAIRRDVIVKEHRLSDRQAKALGYVQEHGSLDIRGFEHLCPEVNRRSLQRDLNILIEKKIFEEKATSPTDPTKSYVLAEEILRKSTMTSYDIEL